MISGYLANSKEEQQFYPNGLQQGLQFLQRPETADLPPGRYEIDGERMYAMIAEYDTEPYAVRRPERHERYTDIQYVCFGEEVIGNAPVAAAGKITEDCLAERDVVFYDSVQNESLLTLKAGMFAVYFPWDVHRPNCQSGDTCGKVRKIVVKIAMDVLK